MPAPLTPGLSANPALLMPLPGLMPPAVLAFGMMPTAIPALVPVP